MPGIVGSTQSPGELLVKEEINLNDYGVIEFGGNGKYFLFENLITSISHKNISCTNISISHRISPHTMQYQFKHQKQKDFNQQNIS